MPLKPRRAPRRRTPPHLARAPSPPRAPRPHVALRVARQSWLAALLALILFALRFARLRTAASSIRHESFPPRGVRPPDLSSLLRLHAARHPAADQHAEPLSFHFYFAPKPFVAADRHLQLRALESWLALSPPPVVTMLGDGEGYDDVAARYALRRVRGVDATFLGVPLFNAMLAATNRTRETVSVLINADILLYDDFPYAIRKIRRDFPPAWLAVAARWDVHAVPSELVVQGPGNRPSEHVRHRVVHHARTNGTLHTYGGIDLWAWDSAAGPLVEATIPPFVYGRGKYDNWLTHEVIRANKRAVVDVSEACTLVHLKHDHHLVPSGGVPGHPAGNGLEEAALGKQQFWSSDPRGKFELFVNSYLAAAHGSYSNQMGTILHAPLKLTSCYEHDGFCIFQRVRPHSCRCEHSPYVAEAQNDPYIVRDSRVVFCGLLSTNAGSEEVDGRERWAITGRMDDDLPDDANATAGVTFGLPLIQEHIFKVISSRTNSNKIFLVVADFSERMLLMELVCSMRAHGLFSWLIIAALDDDLYRFCITRGLPVYLSEFDESDFKDHSNFRELARYQLAFEALRKGKEVYSIEPGLVFFSSPWKYLNNEIADDVNIAVLPRLPETSRLGNEKSYISSAFIYARPSASSMELLKKVMIGLQQHTARSGLLLRTFGCGESDEGLLNVSRCQVGSGTVVHLLDNELFRSVEEGDCANCRNPLLYYSASFGLNSSGGDVSESLRRHGLSRIAEGKDFCTVTS